MEKATSTPMLVELFGHNQIAGMVSEHTIGGSTFIRVDVPETDAQPAFTRMFHPNAVYCLNPVTEEVMASLVDRCRRIPVTPFDIKVAAQKLVEARNQQQADSEGELNDEFDESDPYGVWANKDGQEDDWQ